MAFQAVLLALVTLGLFGGLAQFRDAERRRGEIEAEEKQERIKLADRNTAERNAALNSLVEEIRENRLKMDALGVCPQRPR